MLRRLILGLVKRVQMVSRVPASGDVIHCHIVGIVSRLDRGDYSTCGAFDIKGLKFFAFQRFMCLILCLVLPVGLLAAPASAPYQAGLGTDEQAGKAEADEPVTFDIPPQPLLTALRTYSETTGQAVLVDNTLTVGRQSPGVRGVFDKIEALRRLLAGTGLVASYSSDQAFTLKLAESGESVGMSARERSEVTVGGGIDAVTERYAGQIQGPIEVALCQSDRTRPGTYRLAVQIWIAPSGRVERTRLLTQLNDVQRDNQVRASLSELKLDPPPASLPQPITLLLLPGREVHSTACNSASSLQG
jgi:hypothetical protein